MLNIMYLSVVVIMVIIIIYGIYIYKDSNEYHDDHDD